MSMIDLTDAEIARRLAAVRLATDDPEKTKRLVKEAAWRLERLIATCDGLLADNAALKSRLEAQGGVTHTSSSGDAASHHVLGSKRRLRE